MMGMVVVTRAVVVVVVKVVVIDGGGSGDGSSRNSNKPSPSPLPFTSLPSLVPSSVMVMCLYWLLVFDGTTTAVDLHVHAINAFLMIIDLSTSRWPFYLPHFYMAILYITTYALFNSLYVNLGGTNTVRWRRRRSEGFMCCYYYYYYYCCCYCY